MDKIQGWINLYKPKEISSFNALKKIKLKFNIDKLGHGGTLDPLAEGILPIALGNTTKLIPFINNRNKKYIVNIAWGKQTSTDDIEGKVIKSSITIPSREEIIKKIKNYNGYIYQTPPFASSVKIKGQRAYKLFRKNINFKLKSKKVYLKTIKLLESRKKISKFEIECGKGFYVRSFARDIGLSLGTYAHVNSLKRTKVGNFSTNTSILLDDLLKIGQTLQEFNCIHSSVSMLDDILAYEIESKEDFSNLSLGKSIYIDLDKLTKPILNSFDENYIFLSNKGNVISYGRLNGNLFKPKKIML